MIRSLVAGFAVAGLGIWFSTAARAAELAPPTPVYSMASVAAAYNWSGFYAGGNVGYGWGTADTTTIGFSDPGGLGGVAPAVAAGVIPLSFSPDPKGALVGLQVGYNYQLNPNWVLGAETDFSWSGIKGSQAISTAVVGFFPLANAASQDLDWLGTMRARAGYAANNWLIYGTGGVAYGRVEYSYMMSNAPAGPVNFTGTSSNTSLGWTIGAGIEYGWAHWSLRAEYLYVDLGSHSFAVPLNATPTATFTPAFDNKYNIARAALSYRF